MSVDRPSQAAHTPARRQAGFLSQRTWGVLAVLVALMLIPYWMAKKTNDKTTAKLSVAQDKARPTVSPTQASAAATATIVASGSTPNPDRFGLSFGHGDIQGKSGLMVSTCAGAPLDMGNPDKNQCNPAQGDSSCRTALPVLCVLKDGSTAESAGLVNTTAAAATKTEGVEKPNDASFNLYTGWVSGTLGATAPVAGFVIGSLAQANARCVAELGPGWRMAEVRDATGNEGGNAGNGGGLVGKRGQGLTSQQTRHWVHINDQKANCWDAAPTNSNN